MLQNMIFLYWDFVNIYASPDNEDVSSLEFKQQGFKHALAAEKSNILRNFTSCKTWQMFLIGYDQWPGSVFWKEILETDRLMALWFCH